MGFLTSWIDGLIFYPAPPNPITFPAYQEQEFYFQSGGKQIQGWVFENPRPVSQHTLFYFGGNAEDVTGNFTTIKSLGASRIVFMSYRGYGNSEGKPSQKALYQDALALHDFVVSKYKVSHEQTAVLGRSLGSAVATYLAAQRSLDKVMLVTPFASMSDMGKHVFPFLPVEWLLPHPFPSDEYAATIQAPLLMLIAENDEVIPLSQSEKLFAAWLGTKEKILLEGMAHNDIQMHRKYYRLIRAFLSENLPLD